MANRLINLYYMLLSVAFQRNTINAVHLRSSKRFTIFYRLIQLAIVAYIVGFAIIYRRGYQLFSEARATTSIELKRGTVLDDRHLLSDDEPTCLCSLFTDAIVPPPQVQSAFFVATAPHGQCVDKPPALRNRDRPVDRSGGGDQTGACIDSYFANGKWTRVCELFARCLVDNGTMWSDQREPARIEKNLKVVLTSSVFFPLYAGHRFSNMRSSTNTDYLRTCRFNSETEPLCPVFHLDTIADEADADLESLVVNGGVISIDIRWDCNLDYAASSCLPSYHFRQANELHVMRLGNGFLFSALHRSEMPANGASRRPLTEASGMLFFVRVEGRAGKFHFLQLLLNLGWGWALLAIVTIIRDCIILYTHRNNEKAGQSSWNTMSQHLLDKIFTLLDDGDLYNVLTINRHWSTAAKTVRRDRQQRARGLDYIIRDAGALDKLMTPFERAIDDQQRRIHHRIEQNWLDCNFAKYQLKTRGGPRYAWPIGRLCVADDIVVAVVREYEPGTTTWTGRQWYADSNEDTDDDDTGDGTGDHSVANADTDGDISIDGTYEVPAVRGPGLLWLYAWPLGRRSTVDHGLDGIRLGPKVRDAQGKVSVDDAEKIIAYTADRMDSYRGQAELCVISDYNKCLSSSDFVANTWSVGRLRDLASGHRRLDEIPTTSVVELTARHGLIAILFPWTHDAGVLIWRIASRQLVRRIRVVSDEVKHVHLTSPSEALLWVETPKRAKTCSRSELVSVATDGDRAPVVLPICGHTSNYNLWGSLIDGGALYDIHSHWSDNENDTRVVLLSPVTGQRTSWQMPANWNYNVPPKVAVGFDASICVSASEEDTKDPLITFLLERRDGKSDDIDPCRLEMPLQAFHHAPFTVSRPCDAIDVQDDVKSRGQKLISRCMAPPEAIPVYVGDRVVGVFGILQRHDFGYSGRFEDGIADRPTSLHVFERGGGRQMYDRSWQPSSILTLPNISGDGADSDVDSDVAAVYGTASKAIILTAKSREIVVVDFGIPLDIAHRANDWGAVVSGVSDAVPRRRPH